MRYGPSIRSSTSKFLPAPCVSSLSQDKLNLSRYCGRAGGPTQDAGWRATRTQGLLVARLRGKDAFPVLPTFRMRLNGLLRSLRVRPSLTYRRSKCLHESRAVRDG